ncbi:YqaJ viral recombinase family nuclease [[Actinomadura] parvosata]|uniref:YqaJ viral recombinase family nuclease n=1 Tax=[Actinomadura] parvosata TaxID=1955412 RepID=UPI00406C8ADB
MSARLVLGPEAPREAWLAARLPGITASEIAAVPGLAISPFESPFSLHWKKRGELGETPDNDTMSLGRHLEPWIADKFEAAHEGLTLSLAGLYASTERPWQLCTPDRLVFPASDVVDVEIGCCDLHRYGPPSVYGAMAACCDPDDCGPCCPDCPTCPTLHRPDPPVFLWEGKTSATYDGWGEDGTDEVPAYYRAQVLWQLDVFDLPHAYLSCLFLHTKQTRHYLIERDETDLAFMREQAVRFLEGVEAGDPPPLDGHKATTSALKWLHPKLEDREQEVPASVATSFTKLCELAKETKADKDAWTNELRAAMGDARHAVHNGQKIATRSIYDQNRVDVERLRRDYPDAYKACLKTSTVDKIIPARTKDAA